MGATGDKSKPDHEDAGEAVGIVDKTGEAWEFNILTGELYRI